MQNTAAMYTPPHNRESRVSVLHGAIGQIRLGTLITVGAQGPLATHVPMFVTADPAPNGTIFGHLARANGQWEKSDLAFLALAAFVGPHAYITPSWYETKRLTGKVVPTWQYLAVQARGPISFFDDRERLHDIVRRSTQIMESSREHPWAVEDAPLEYVERMLGAIIGFEIPVETLEGAWKFSQNKNAADLRGVIDGLEERGDAEVAALVRGRGGVDGPRDPLQP
jgi:transcriptional regulator